MKNIKLILLYGISFFPFLQLCHAQSESYFSIQSKIGIAVFEKMEKPKYYTSYDTIRYSSIPGINLVGGIGYHQRLGKKFGVSSSILFEFAQFSRVRNNSSTINNLSQVTFYENQFRTRSFLLPVRFHYQLKKIRFSLGVIATYHYSTRLKKMQKSFSAGILNSERTEIIKDGERYVYTVAVGGHHWFHTQGRESTFLLEKKFNAQLILGSHYRLTSKLNLDFEYRQYVVKNKLHGRSSQTYHPFSKTASLGVSWKFLK